MAKILEFEGLVVGDDVMYNEPSQSWVPAKIISIHPKRNDVGEILDTEPPILSLVVFVTGQHLCTFSKERAIYGTESGHWLTKRRALEACEDPEKARSAAEAKQLAALKVLEDAAAVELAKLPPEVQAQRMADPAHVDPEAPPAPPAQPEPPEQVEPEQGSSEEETPAPPAPPADKPEPPADKPAAKEKKAATKL